LTDPAHTGALVVGEWTLATDTGRLRRDDVEVSLEPQLVDLLVLLAREPGRVMSRSALETALWPDTIVGEDTLARTVSRLRRALGDSAQSPSYIETLPKRGYRLIASVTAVPALSATAARRRWPVIAALAAAGAVALVWWLSPADEAPIDPHARQVSRANDLYMQFTLAQNEAAIALYQNVLAADPEHPGAQAGLANALVQRVVRWPSTIGATRAGAASLHDALDSGLTTTPQAQSVLDNAAAMAERAVRAAPSDAAAIKALAFAETARGNLARGEALYRQLLELDSDYWAAWINLGEIQLMGDDLPAAVALFEEGFDAMTRAYDHEPQRVGPWLVGMAIVIGDAHLELEQPGEAEAWYRRALAEVPYEPEATGRLAGLLAANGNAVEALSLCEALKVRLGVTPGCEALLR
ncbi:MAG: winged helix-turn-helix domain-containing protein, partial [Pseudomonadota bacterium]